MNRRKFLSTSALAGVGLVLELDSEKKRKQLVNRIGPSEKLGWR